MQTARLEQWAVLGTALYGNIHDDEKCRWENGHPIKIGKHGLDRDILSKLKEGDVVTTTNTSYLLGKQAGL